MVTKQESPRIGPVLARLASVLEGWSWLDGPSQGLNGVVLKVAKPGRARDLASGRQLGHPAHPLLVTVPVGAWTSALVLDALGHRDASRTLTGLGVLAAVPTAITGLSDWADTTGAEQRIGFVHLVGNSAATSCFAASWWARRRNRRATGVALGLMGAVLSSAAGWLGGHLAYSLGVGVDTNAFEGGPTEWTLVQGEPPVGSVPASVQADGVALMVARTDSAIRVLANRCSHRGAPLSDGQVDDGCVTCPWHASQFDLTSGAVRRGPATVPQPTYQVREAAGGLEVRRHELRSLRTNSVRGR